MEELDSRQILELTEELCKIPSVSGNGAEENECAQFIYDYLSHIVPSTSNALTVKQLNCVNDGLGRKAVLALYRTPMNTSRTVLLTGHFDVVSADVYGKLKDVAFDPELCTEVIGNLELPPSVKEDLDSGNWLFGRGSMDMKYGLAMFMLAMKAAALSRELPVNLLFLAVPDEEGNSAGMRGALPCFQKFIEDEHLDVVAGLSGEPCFMKKNSLGEEVRPYWTGTVGKAMPFVLSIGKESHVNDYDEGLNAALLCAWVVEAMEGRKDFLPEDVEYDLPPPACLYMATLRKEYSVTLPGKAIAYFNVLTANASPERILKRTTEVVELKLRLEMEGEETKKDIENTDSAHQLSIQTPNIRQFSELVEKAKSAFGSLEEYEKALSQFRESLSNIKDERQRGILEAEWLWDRSGLSGPSLVVGFLPPYYPPRLNRMVTPEERHLRKIMEEEVKIGEELAGNGKNILLDCFAGITDMSFLGFEGDPKELDALKENMPGWGSNYWLPIEELQKLNIPVASMGPSGKDAHKATERLELDYSLKVAPRLLRETIWKLGSQQGGN